LGQARPGLAIIAVGAMIAAACDPVRDVVEPPILDPPSLTAVLQGTITGLGSRRPIGLQYNGTNSCIDPEQADEPDAPLVECRFFGVLGQASSAFSFGSLPVGTAYDIRVSTQPYGKSCSVANGAGTVGTAGAPPIQLTCVNDPAVPRYSVSGTIAAEASGMPGLEVILTTEEGVRRIAATGRTQFEFADAVFDSGTSLPVFGWSVTATIPAAVAGGPLNNCNVNGGPVAGTGSNIAPDGSVVAAPTADVTGLAITACAFSVEVRAEAASGGPAALNPGLTVALRHQRTGVESAPASIDAFGAAGAAAFTGILSNSDAIYELVITTQPAGQACVAGFGSAVPGSTPTDAGAVLLLLPAGATVGGSWLVRRVLRCRSLPPPGARLQGVYQQFIPAPEGELPTRNFMAFFDDGTYLYGAHGFLSITSGVEHGFYSYDAAGGTITLQPYTDTSGVGGLSSNAAPVTLTNVVHSAPPASRISATLAGFQVLFREPRSIEAQMTGAWATPDRRRIWVYDASTYNGFHAGVNGAGNAQDACFTLDDAAALAGYFTRRGNATTCELAAGSGEMLTLDIPNAQTMPRMPPGFIGKWPQSGSNADGRPSSPVLYVIEPGAPDVLTVQNTAHDGSPVNAPIVLQRVRAGLN
jgi:hypothetical protein